jgi:hypothetical protein
MDRGSKGITAAMALLGAGLGISAAQSQELDARLDGVQSGRLELAQTTTQTLESRQIKLGDIGEVESPDSRQLKIDGIDISAPAPTLQLQRDQLPHRDRTDPLKSEPR